MRVIAVATMKGGTGKTTTAAALIAGATKKGLNVLGVDFDAQCNLTFIMGGSTDKGSILQGLNIQHTPSGDLAAGDIDIATVSDPDALKNRLKQVKDYDLIVIDCPPNLGQPLFCAIRAATEVLIPLQADSLSLQGLYQMCATIRKANPQAAFSGVFLTRYNGRRIVSRDMAAAIQEQCQKLRIPYLDTPVRECVAVPESQVMQEDLFKYAPRSNAVEDYLALMKVLKIRK